MIAIHGIAGVSLRQINEAAGHRNQAAIHYHFGSRLGLVEAIVTYRYSAIEGRRDAILATLGQHPQHMDVRALIGALAYPLIAESIERDGPYFLRFCERVSRERDQIDATELFPSGSWRRTRAALAECISYLPPDLAQFRVDLAWEQVVSGLAGIEARRTNGFSEIAGDMEVETVIDFVTAGFTAPVGRQVMNAIRGA